MKTPIVKIGNVKIGGGNPIVIQSMTNTDTSDAKKTAAQCMELADAGAEIIRITVNDEAAAKAVPEIRKILDKKGYKNLPLVGDFHFNGHKLLSGFPDCAKILDKYRINPGNVGEEKNFKEIIKIAKKYNKPIRIGANCGSFERRKMIESVLKSARLAEKLGLKQNQIILSVKMSDVNGTVETYEELVRKMEKHPYALHLGLTEAGMGLKGIISSCAALSILLKKGIGDTIRISITPEKSRTQEVEACKILLQSLDLRQFQPEIISCPGCGRTNNKLFQKIVKEVSSHIQKNQKKLSRPFKIAIMGCIVNGPGEARHADIALILPGKTETPIAQVYKKGKFVKNLNGNNISQKFIRILNQQ